MFMGPIRDVNKATGSKAKAKANAPSLKAKACQLNPRPGQGPGHSWTRPIISALRIKEILRKSDTDKRKHNIH